MYIAAVGIGISILGTRIATWSQFPVVVIVLLVSCCSQQCNGSLIIAITAVCTAGNILVGTVIDTEMRCTFRNGYLIGKIAVKFLSVPVILFRIIKTVKLTARELNTVCIICIGIGFHEIARESFSDRLSTIGIFEEFYMEIIPAVFTVTAENEFLCSRLISHTAVSGRFIVVILLYPVAIIVDKCTDTSVTLINFSFDKVYPVGSVIRPIFILLMEFYILCTIRRLNLP